MSRVHLPLEVVRDQRLDLPPVAHMQQLARVIATAVVTGSLASAVVTVGWVIWLLAR